jgi:glutaredoxin 3
MGGGIRMASRKTIEVFSTGCAVCQEAVDLVKRVAGADHNVEVLDMHHADVAAKAKQHGVRRVPSVVIDGQLAHCCTDGGPDEATLRAAVRR